MRPDTSGIKGLSTPGLCWNLELVVVLVRGEQLDNSLSGASDVIVKAKGCFLCKARLPLGAGKLLSELLNDFHFFQTCFIIKCFCLDLDSTGDVLIPTCHLPFIMLTLIAHRIRNWEKTFMIVGVTTFCEHHLRGHEVTCVSFHVLPFGLPTSFLFLHFLTIISHNL